MVASVNNFLQTHVPSLHFLLFLLMHSNHQALLHQYLAFISAFFFFQWIFGFLIFFFPGAAPNLKRNALPWHVFFGLFVYILALANAELGLLEKITFLQSTGLARHGPESFLVNFTALVVILLGGSVVMSVIAPVHGEDPLSYSAI